MENKLHVVLLFVIVFGFLQGACHSDASVAGTEITADALVNQDSMQKMISEKTKQFTEAHITRDTAFLNNIFSADAHAYPPGADIVKGREAIAAINEEWVNYGISEFTETTIRFYGDENFLIDEGVYALRYGEDNILDQGKYINIWKQENGEWKICSNIWNAGAPEDAEE